MQVILFDVDGTLIRGDGAGRRALEKAFVATFNLERVAEATRGIRFSGVLDPVIHAGMADALGVAPDLMADRQEDFRRNYLDHLGRECRQDRTSRVLPGVVALLDRLQAGAGARLGLVTGNIEAGARIKLERHGLNPYFIAGGFGDDGPTRAAVARVALERVARGLDKRIPPGQVMVIGDSELDVECGRSNGFRTLAVATGWTSPEILAVSGPDHLVEDLGCTEEILKLLA
jgi:phosphoglycolate phosphatase-like HAD superfamily hydrolase